MRLLTRVVLGLVVLLLLIQLVPYGRDHGNPSPSRELRFETASTERLFTGACGDCHGDHTSWPWYSNVAPASWLVENDVDGGRRQFNVSAWDQAQPALDKVLEEITGGGMPPMQYKLIHGEARLSKAERTALAGGLRASWTADPPASIRH